MAGGLATLTNLGWTYLALVNLNNDFLPILVPMEILEALSTFALAAMIMRWRSSDNK